MPVRTAKKSIHHLHQLGGGTTVVRKAVARLLNDLPLTDATAWMQEVIELARQGWEPANCVLKQVTQALELETDILPHANALRRVAALQELAHVEILFTAQGATKEYNLNAAKKADAKLFTASLGHLKTRARITRDPDELERLSVASEPSIIKNLLLNPRLTEERVVRMAARRPARPEPLIEIWHSARWSARPRVRKALAFNPYLPAEIGAKIVPLLLKTELVELNNDRGVHQKLREQARALIEIDREEKEAEDDPAVTLH